MKVKDVLKLKGPEVYTVGEDKFLSEAISTLVKNNIGSLIVLNEDARITGIISERDVLKMTFNNPDSYGNLIAKDVMSKNLIIVEPDDDMEYCESVMTENRIRHLPVVKDKVLIGIISIGDVVKAQISQIRHDNKYLRDYIEGMV